MASYAPAGMVLLVIGGTATAVNATHDPIFALLIVFLGSLAYGVGAAVVRAGIAGGGDRA